MILLEKSVHFTWLFFIFKFESTRTGESLINLTSIPCSMGQTKLQYKDSNYKDAKWRKIAEIWVSLKMMPSRNGNLYEIHMSDIKISKQKVVMA